MCGKKVEKSNMNIMMILIGIIEKTKRECN